jgi:hypothetical protein
MHYRIQPRKVTLSGNSLLVKPLTRREAEDFRAAMFEAGNDEARTTEIGLELVRKNATFDDGSELDVDEVPQDDLVRLLRLVLGGGDKSVADFTGTP